MAKNLGEKVDDDDIRNMMLIANPEINGEVDFDQFYELMSTRYEEKYLEMLKNPDDRRRTVEKIEMQKNRFAK